MLVGHRKGLIAAVMMTRVDGSADRDAALLMLGQKQWSGLRCITAGTLSWVRAFGSFDPTEQQLRKLWKLLL